MRNEKALKVKKNLNLFSAVLENLLMCAIYHFPCSVHVMYRIIMYVLFSFAVNKTSTFAKNSSRNHSSRVNKSIKSTCSSEFTSIDYEKNLYYLCMLPLVYEI